MKVVFKKKGKDESKEHIFKAKTKNDYKVLLTIVNYELYRKRVFADLDFSDVLTVKCDGEKMSLSELLNKIENVLKYNKFDDDDSPKKDKKKKKKNKDKKKKEKNDKKSELTYDDKHILNIKHAVRLDIDD